MPIGSTCPRLTVSSLVRWTLPACLVMSFLIPPLNAQTRTWKDPTGKYKVKAELVGVRGDSDVVLKRADGKTITVKISRLSKADQDYIARAAARGVLNNLPAVAPDEKPQQGDSPPDEPPPMTPRATTPTAAPPSDARVEPPVPASEAVANLLYRVKQVSAGDLSSYEQLLRGKNLFDAILFLGALSRFEKEVQQVRTAGLEREGIAALVALLKSKRDSNEKKDHIVCVKALRALEGFGPAADEATPLLDDLAKHNVAIVKTAAAGVLKKVAGQKPAPGDSGKVQPASGAAQEVRDFLAWYRPASTAEAGEAFMKRIGSIDAAIIDSWTAALAKATQESPSREQAFSFLDGFHPAFKDDRYQPADAARYLARLQRFPPQALRKWQEALDVFQPGFKANDFAHKAIALQLLLDQEGLFAGDALRGTESKQRAARLVSVPRSAASAWAVVVNPKNKAEDSATMLELRVAVSLTQMDSLFVQDRFQPQAFESSLAELKRAITK